MSPIQTEYTERMLPPSPGTIAGSDFNTKTGTCEEADGIGFGLAVSQGSADKGVALGGLLADFLGVSIKDITVPANAASPDEYPQYRNVGYLSRGQIWVLAGAAVSADDAVHYDATTGAFSNTGGQGPIPGARWVTSAANGDRALIELQARGA